MTQEAFEFLQRALGQSEDSGKLEITLGALPPDLPVTLPNLPDLRVLGGVRRSIAHWIFEYPTQLQEPTEQREKSRWLVFLDTSSAPAKVLEALLEALLPLNWQSSAFPIQPPIFVTTDHVSWMGIQPKQRLKLNLHAVKVGKVTQVWLNLENVNEEQITHFLGEQDFSRPTFYQAALPTLMLPQGWQVQLGNGSSGPVHSQHYLLRPAEAIQDALGELWPHLLPQLERQGWRLLHRELHHEEGLTVYRTPLGVGTLGLRRVGAELVAQIVHVTDGPDGGRSISSFTISSGA